MSSVKLQRETLEVEIERLLPGGVGLAHAGGLTLFVSLAAPGDVVRIAIDRLQGKVGFGSIVEILKPSAVRIEPPCPYFGRCGGCDFQQLTYEAQLQAKVEIINDCLRRIARLQIPFDIEIHPSPTPWHYRARATWQLDALGRLLGYFERGSNRVCDVEYCAVLVPELQKALEQVRTDLHSETNKQQPRTIDAVVGTEGVSLSSQTDQFQAREVSGNVGSETYHFSADAFFQVNQELLASLVTEAIRGSSGTVHGQIAIDLYCGVGLFTLPLARNFSTVIGVEANPRATEFARRNVIAAQRESLRGNATSGYTEIVTSPVSEWLEKHTNLLGPIDFLLLDPPRAGVENRVVAGILNLRPRLLTYVSCDPATLARDLKKLLAGGYTLDSLAAFDMFPQTHHVEVVARLAQRS
ncbi:MAG: class I SAM-dependent RNA methyltransferase [Pyrinomonadaceae bacterium]